MNRCKWCDIRNEKYVKYHDEEWSVLNLDEHYLFEMLVLEMMQAGLSWQCVLNKRENFRKTFDCFDVKKASDFTDERILELMNDKGIIRNRKKIEACRNNAKIFLVIQKDFGTFEAYLRTFWDGKVIYDSNSTKNHLSDEISSDLKKRGMRFCGSTIIYSFLQAIGIINGHEQQCFLYKK